MPYEINAFTTLLDLVGDTTGGDDVNFLTGNDGISVPPTSNNIFILGVSPLTVTGNIAASTLSISLSTSGYVSSATGTPSQVLINGSAVTPQTGAITIALPQSIATNSTPTFGGLTIGSLTGILQGTVGVVSTITVGTTLQFVGDTLDISATYPGQSSIVTIGTISTGTWHGSVVAGQYGGTGVNNGALTITLSSGAVGKVLVSDVSGNATWAALSGVSVTSITGTVHQIIASSPTGAITLSTPQDIDTTSSPTFAALTLSSPLSGASGGTGVSNSGKTITLGGSLTTAGAFASTFTMTGATSVTFPTSGTLATTSGTVASITGTADRITIGGTSTNVTIDIAATYVGQTSITTLGTITSGTWTATPINLSLYASGTLQAAQFPALTGDITTSAGSLATTLATVNANVGSFGSSTSIPSFTVNAKGLITAASGNVVIAPAGTLTGTTLAANVVTSSLTSVGTISTGVWNGTVIVGQYGGTGVNNSTLTITLASGAVGKVLSSDSSGNATWAALSGLGVTSITGTASQVLANGTSGSAQTGAVTLTLATPLDVTVGGTGTSTAFTLGSVVFAGTSGVYSQDNSNFFWNSTNHNMGLGTASPNSASQITVAGSRAVSIYDISNRSVLLSGIQASLFDDASYSAASSVTIMATVLSEPTIIMQTGQTLTEFAAFYSNPIYSSLSSVGTISFAAGFFFKGGTTTPAVMTASYGGYFAAPLAGVTKTAVYSANAAIGSYTATTPPSNGLVVSGNTSIGSSSAASQFNVGSSNQFQIDATGIVTSGTWNGGVVAGQYGGTGVVNTGLSITLASGAVGKVLVSDISGNATWAALSGIGVTSLTGTASQVLVNGTSGSATTGAITLTLPQNIDTTSGPTFDTLTITTSATCPTIYGHTTFDNNGITSGDGVTIMGASNPTGPTAGLQNNTSFLVNANVTNVWAEVISCVMGANPTFTLTNAYGLAVLAGGTGGTVTNGISIYATEPGYGINKWAAQFLGRVDIGTTGQASFSRLGVLTLGTALTPGNGGTGLASYAVGDIIYASGATTLSKLADVATGNALISGGVTTAPSWGKIGLTTHVSGVLPVANGGTNATSFTLGSVVFAGTSGTYTQDNANFFWDTSNHALALGTTTQATTTLLTLFSSTQVSSRLTLTGQEFNSAATTSTEGVALLCGLNRTNLRSLWIADSARLTRNSSNAALCLSARTDIGPLNQIDSISTDRSTGLPLSINPSGGNVSIFSETTGFGSGVLVIFIANATTVPTTNPSGGGLLYVQSGALKYRGSGGSVTNLAPA